LSRPYICIEETTLGGVEDNRKIVAIYKYKYICKTNRFIHFKKELIESGEYTEFDLVLRERG
tara:strand:- start:132 stop:317 length:186 start_codon:yes stop_codon:yes gene_type:complete